MPEDGVPAIVNELSHEVIGHAIEVHRGVGPGLMERPYKLLLAARLAEAGHEVKIEHPMPLRTGQTQFDRAYVADLIVDDILLIEVKAVGAINYAMIAQAKTYVRLGGYPLGLLLNFHAPRLALDGIKRIYP